jgi:hypothetical protein
MYCHVSGVPWRIIMGSGLDNWIYWHSYYNYAQLRPIIISHKQWLSKTRSIPSLTTSVFSSTLTDLALIYETVTSSVSVVRWLPLHSWTLNWLTDALNDDCLSNELVDDCSTTDSSNYVSSFYNSLRTADRTLSWIVHLLFRLFVVTGTCVNPVATNPLCRIRS